MNDDSVLIWVSRDEWQTWSQPLQVRAEQWPDGEWTLIMRDRRSVEGGEGAWRVFHRIMEAPTQ